MAREIDRTWLNRRSIEAWPMSALLLDQSSSAPAQKIALGDAQLGHANAKFAEGTSRPHTTRSGTIAEAGATLSVHCDSGLIYSG